MNAKFTGSALVLALVLFTCGALASIEREPVRVDLNNARLKYDIDDLERTRVLAENNQESNQVATGPRPVENTNNNVNRDDSSHQDAPMISIRRIFLVPMSPPSLSSSSDDSDQGPMSDPMRMFGMPPRSLFSPFSTRHLFGGDEASRPKPDESQERPVVESAAKPEQEATRPMSAMFDPIEMLMEAMRQALNPANMLPPQPESTDLNKEASGEKKLTPEGSDTGLVDKKPQSFNSTKEDIVEIDGKKYVRKTVINRHVGDGIMFMTRRLIFSPLNETESTTENKKEPSEAPSTEQPTKVEKIDEPANGDNSKAASPAASEPSTDKEPVASETTPASPQEPSSTTTVATDKEETTTTTTAKSLGDKITDTMSKVERLMEKMVERKEEPAAPASTDKPSSS